MLTATRPKLLESRAVGPETHGDDHFALAALTHCFLEEFQRGFLVTAPAGIAFRQLAFVIHRPPELVSLAADLHENLVEMAAPVARPHALHKSFPHLSSKHRPEQMPPEAHGLGVDADAILMKQILGIPQ